MRGKTIILLVILLAGILIVFKGKSEDNQYEVYISQYTLSSGYTMNIFQVSGMKDKELEDKVNESLNSYLYTLVEPWFLPENLEEYEPIIHCQTDRYLSVEYAFEYTTAFKPTTWHYCITVNMQNGEVVFWDDIIDVNETFAERIKNDSIIKKAEWEWWYTEEEMIELENEWFSKRKIDYIQRFFNDFTRDYLYGDYYRENGYIMSSYEPYIYNHTFWLEEGKICFTGSSSDYSIDWIMIDDIEDLLKVPKW